MEFDSQLAVSELPSDLYTFITFNVLAVLTLITPFVMFHHVSGINYLYLFIKLILVPVPSFPIHLAIPSHINSSCFDSTLLIQMSVRPSTKSVFDFNEIWHVGRGR